MGDRRSRGALVRRARGAAALALEVVVAAADPVFWATIDALENAADKADDVMAATRRALTNARRRRRRLVWWTSHTANALRGQR